MIECRRGTAGVWFVVSGHWKIQKRSYVDVYMKWKKDHYYDSIESIHESIELKRIINLKNCIFRNPNGCIPISDVSKRGKELKIPKIKVATFLRMYPSVFEEYKGPLYNLPWFRLTKEAADLAGEECRAYEDHRSDLRERLKKLILMSREKVLPLKIIRGMQWYLGLPDDFLQDTEVNLDDSFRSVQIDDETDGLAVVCDGKIESVMQKNWTKRGMGSENAIRFPLFPSKGLRLRRKIKVWLEEFQRLPYVSPYEEFSHLDPNSDESEKRIVGIVHELLSLFVEHAAERRKLLCLKKYMALPQKFHKVFERHPHLFYLSLKKKTCTAILKEAYRDRPSIDVHPLAEIRSKYIDLMMKSKDILRRRRANHPPSQEIVPLDLDSEPEDVGEETEPEAENA